MKKERVTVYLKNDFILRGGKDYMHFEGEISDKYQASCDLGTAGFFSLPSSEKNPEISNILGATYLDAKPSSGRAVFKNCPPCCFVAQVPGDNSRGRNRLALDRWNFPRRLAHRGGSDPGNCRWGDPSRETMGNGAWWMDHAWGERHPMMWRIWTMPR